MSKARCLLLLGGNMGDRRAKLRAAERGLASLRGTRLLRRSRLYETAPVGPSSRPFLNRVVEVETALSPMGLLVEAKRLEAEAGRRPGRRWGARPLDVDVLSFGARRIRTRWLAVPHPLILARAFVLAPLCDLAPRWRPDGRVTAARRLRELKPGPGIVRMVADGQ